MLQPNDDNRTNDGVRDGSGYKIFITTTPSFTTTWLTSSALRMQNVSESNEGVLGFEDNVANVGIQWVSERNRRESLFTWLMFRSLCNAEGK